NAAITLESAASARMDQPCGRKTTRQYSFKAREFNPSCSACSSSSGSVAVRRPNGTTDCGINAISPAQTEQHPTHGSHGQFHVFFDALFEVPRAEFAPVPLHRGKHLTGRNGTNGYRGRRAEAAERAQAPLARLERQHGEAMSFEHASECRAGVVVHVVDGEEEVPDVPVRPHDVGHFDKQP